MRKIKLLPDQPFVNNVDVKILDVTEEREKLRATITLEFARVDLEPFFKKGMGLEEILEEYRERINRLLRYYLLNDFEIVAGLEETLKIVRERVESYLNQ